MKTSSFRISDARYESLREIADAIPGCSVLGLINRFIDLGLEVEGPVLLATFREASAKLKRKERQPVVVE